MKLAFTTLGCLEWDMPQIIEKAHTYGYAGVDFRGYLGEMQLWKTPAFSRDIGTTRRMFEDTALTIPCFGSSARMYAADPAKRGEHLDEVKRFVELCHALGVPLIRVFGGALDGNSFDAAVPAAAEMLCQMADAARPAGVNITIETHDDWVYTDQLARVFAAVGHLDNASVLWDVNHPYRTAGETPETTWANIGPLVRYTHWKDSVLVPAANPGEKDRVALTLPGDGTLPLRDFCDTLTRGGYTGWYTLEWERKWHPELPPADIAFPRFVSTMRAFQTA